MIYQTPTIQTSPFKEHPFCDLQTAEPESFEIGLHGNFELQIYCECIISKLQNFERSDLKPFIEYQCTLMNKPLIWLNKFEKLIQINYKEFANDTTRICKMYSVIEVLRDKFQNQSSENTTFDFRKLKKQLEFSSTPTEKLKVLKTKKTEYLQANTHNINALADSFVKQVDLEISLLTDLQALESPLSEERPQKTFKKLKFNGNINVLVDVFYQMMEEKISDNKPFIQADIKEIATFLMNNFLDKENRELSESSIKTMLTPSRFDKRPKGEKQIKIVTT